MIKLKATPRLIFAFLIFITSLRIHANDELTKVSKIESYISYQQKVIDLISSAQKKVWLAARNLNDSEVTTALYLAKYRKVNTKVFLSQKALKRYDSQAAWLKSLAIDLSYIPEQHFNKWTLILLKDKDLFFSDYVLNGEEPLRLINFYSSKKSDLKNYYQDFFKSTNIDSQFSSSLLIPKKNKIESKHTIEKQPKIDTYRMKRSYKDRNLPRQLPELTKWQKKNIDHNKKGDTIE